LWRTKTFKVLDLYFEKWQVQPKQNLVLPAKLQEILLAGAGIGRSASFYQRKVQVSLKFKIWRRRRGSK
jgi:hypothetical protein